MQCVSRENKRGINLVLKRILAVFALPQLRSAQWKCIGIGREIKFILKVIFYIFFFKSLNINLASRLALFDINLNIYAICTEKFALRM